MEDFIKYAKAHGYSTEIRDINPVYVCQWLLSKPNNELTSILASKYCPALLKALLSQSKYPMALFITRDYLRSLISEKPFNPEVFETVFNILFQASKKFATDPKGADLLRKLPDELPIDRGSIDQRFLTKTSDSFRMTLVIDLYKWLPSTVERQLLTQTLNELIPNYLKEISKTCTLGKYKKTRCLLSCVSKLNCHEEHKISDKNINEEFETLLCEFLEIKKAGIRILYGAQLVSDTTWTRCNSISNEGMLRHFIGEVLKKKSLNGIQLSVYNLSIEDFLYYKNNFSMNANKLSAIRQFLGFLIERGANHNNNTDSIVQLFLKLPTYKSLKLQQVSNRPLNYLSRKDVICLIKIALKTCKKNTRLRYAIYIGIIGFCALRKIEATCLQVGDFNLDENGLLADLNDGYGRLQLPSFKSKGCYSPSHKDYGTLVVPRLRSLINLYLQSEHMKGYNESTFLFRSSPVSEHDTLFDNVTSKNFSDGKWLKKVSSIGTSIMDQIYTRARPFLDKYKGPISSHDLRRSANQFILDATANVPAMRQIRVAGVHLRHSKGDSKQRAYINEPENEDYVKCIHAALNFPWEQAELIKWETKHFYVMKKRDWGSINGHKKIPSASELEKQYNENNFITAPPLNRQFQKAVQIYLKVVRS